MRSILWLLLIIPVIGKSQEPLPDEALQRQWLEIQASRDRRVIEYWWQRLDPDRLNAYVESGADVNASDRRGWTPLHSAARYNPDPAVLLVLLRAGADVDAKDRAGDTPLHWAAAENANVDVVTSLIGAGAEVNAVDRFGWLPIHTAAERNPNPEVISALLEAGAKRKRRAYFVLFSPAFLLKHNSNMSETDRKAAMALLKAAE